MHLYKPINVFGVGDDYSVSGGRENCNWERNGKDERGAILSWLQNKVVPEQVEGRAWGTQSELIKVY